MGWAWSGSDGGGNEMENPERPGEGQRELAPEVGVRERRRTWIRDGQTEALGVW